MLSKIELLQSIIAFNDSRLCEASARLAILKEWHLSIRARSLDLAVRLEVLIADVKRTA